MAPEFIRGKPYILPTGAEVYTNKQMLEPDGDAIEIRRSWRERLFSWPWRPLRATRLHQPMKPSTKVYGMNVRGKGRVMVMHPVMLEHVKKLVITHDQRKQSPTGESFLHHHYQ